MGRDDQPSHRLDALEDFVDRKADGGQQQARLTADVVPAIIHDKLLAKKNGIVRLVREGFIYQRLQAFEKREQMDILPGLHFHGTLGSNARYEHHKSYLRFLSEMFIASYREKYHK